MSDTDDIPGNFLVNLAPMDNSEGHGPEDIESLISEWEASRMSLDRLKIENIVSSIILREDPKRPSQQVLDLMKIVAKGEMLPAEFLYRPLIILVYRIVNC
jgi:hypothetical protein